MGTTRPTDGHMLDSRGVGSLLGVGEKTVERLARQGKIPAGIKVGRCRRWPRQQILDWIDARSRQPATTPAD